MKPHYVYIHTRADTGEPFYIGKGKGRRLHDSDKKRNPYWRNVAAKHGWSAHVVAEFDTHDEALAKEVELIAFAKEQGYALTNLTIGGEGVVFEPGSPQALAHAERVRKTARKMNAALTPEQRREAARKANAARTPEQRREAGRKGAAALTPEQRREAGRKGAAALTPEQRREAARKMNAALTPEQCRERARKANAALTPEQRREAGRKGTAALTPEQRSERVRKAWATRRANQA